MKINRLPVDTGLPGWNAILPPPDLPEELDGTITADWLVIGGGLSLIHI